MKKIYVWAGIIGFLLFFIAAHYLIAATPGIPISVPSATSSGYMLVSSDNGRWIGTSTDPAHFGSIFATSTATSTFLGSLRIASTTATSSFLGGLIADLLYTSSTTATSTFANGIQLSAGCFRLADGTCAGSGGAGTALTYITVSNEASLTGERALTGTSNQITITDNGANSSIVLATPQNIHTAATPTFSDLTLSSFTLGSVVFAGTGGTINEDNANLFWDDTANRLGLGTTTPGTLLSVQGTTTISGGITAYSNILIPSLTATSSNATSSFAGLIEVLGTGTSTYIRNGFQTGTLNVTSNSASSTFGGGIVVQGGVRFNTYNCSTYASGGKITTNAAGYLTCADDGGGGGVTVNSGTANRLAYYSGASTIDSGTNLFWDNTNLGIGTTTLAAANILGVQGNALISGTTTVGALIATSTVYIGPGGTSTITAEYARFNQHGVIAQKSATESLTSDTDTALTYNQEIWDPWDLHNVSSNTTRLTAKIEGIYFVTAHTDIAASGTGRRGCYLKKNGLNDERHGGIVLAAAPQDGSHVSCNAYIKMVPGDYVEFIVNQNSGGALNANSVTSWLSKFSMMLVAK